MDTGHLAFTLFIIHHSKNELKEIFKVALKVSFSGTSYLMHEQDYLCMFEI